MNEINIPVVAFFIALAVGLVVFIVYQNFKDVGWLKKKSNKGYEPKNKG
jgi:hypothetical protein